MYIGIFFKTNKMAVARYIARLHFHNVFVISQISDCALASHANTQHKYTRKSNYDATTRLCECFAKRMMTN